MSLFEFGEKVGLSCFNTSAPGCPGSYSNSILGG